MKKMLVVGGGLLLAFALFKGGGQSDVLENGGYLTTIKSGVSDYSNKIQDTIKDTIKDINFSIGGGEISIPPISLGGFSIIPQKEKTPLQTFQEAFTGGGGIITHVGDWNVEEAKEKAIEEYEKRVIEPLIGTPVPQAIETAMERPRTIFQNVYSSVSSILGNIFGW